MVEMKVMALAWVAMIDRAMAYHGMVFPASRYSFKVVERRLFQSPYATMKTIEAPSTHQSRVFID